MDFEGRAECRGLTQPGGHGRALEGMQPVPAKHVGLGPGQSVEGHGNSTELQIIIALQMG